MCVIVINGTKLVILSGRGASPFRTRIKFLIGGFSLIAASSFTVFASTVYNQAIATTNTDLVANAVIILFIADIDEMTYAFLTTIIPCLADSEDISVELKDQVMAEMKIEWEQNMKVELKKQVIAELKTEWEQDMKVELKNQVIAEIKTTWEKEMKIELEKQVQAEIAKLS